MVNYMTLFIKASYIVMNWCNKSFDGGLDA